MVSDLGWEDKCPVGSRGGLDKIRLKFEGAVDLAIQHRWMPRLGRDLDHF